jgi:hypothetical protein
MHKQVHYKVVIPKEKIMIIWWDAPRLALIQSYVNLFRLERAPLDPLIQDPCECALAHESK